jgi:hypothetical protein
VASKLARRLGCHFNTYKIYLFKKKFIKVKNTIFNYINFINNTNINIYFIKINNLKNILKFINIKVILFIYL